MGKRQYFFDDQGNTVDTEPDTESVDEMHPRNLYKDNPPDFEALAQQYESFRPFVHKGDDGRPYIDFKNPKAVRELTCCLLKRDFSLTVTLPLDRLCPPIPNRLNYILWIEDLLAETQQEPTSKEATNKTKVVGIDIGVGASCIYPLLGCQTNPHWRFFGTELDEESMDYAKKNVDQNGLQDRISLVLTKDPLRIFPPPLLTPTDMSYDFCMCNPPFYASEQEVQEGYESKELEPSAICTGTPFEMITVDGEYGFIQRMILESVRHKDRIRWYTCMIGLKRTIRPIVQILKQNKITNYVVTEFCQGRTKRWGIAWSFTSRRVVKSNSLETYRPKSQFIVRLPMSADQAKPHLQAILTDLDIALPAATLYDKQDVAYAIHISPKHNTWSRAARRLRKRQKQEQDDHGHAAQQQQDASTISMLTMECALLTTSSVPSYCVLRTSWLQGDDRSTFESFWNHIKKRMEQEAGIYSGSIFQK